MRSILFASMIFAMSACGDDGGSPAIDAGPTDGGGGDGSGSGSTTLGQACSQQMPCPAATPICAVLVQNQPGFCTVSCGMTPDTGNPDDPGNPPANGTQICTQAGMGSTGTPVCALTGSPQGGQTPWACGIACGTFMGQNLGTCPTGLTCGTDNLCGP